MWLNKFFRNKANTKISKTEYFQKFQLIELFSLLHQAEKIIENKRELNLDKFRNEFIDEIYAIERENVADFTKIWNWFKPNNEWDKIAKSDDQILGKKIFEITDYWKRNQEFIAGTKVSLENENGVVIDKEEDGMFGIIRWDTNKEIDFEDWRGLIGVFFDSGGKILSQSFEFKYINDDGTLKNGYS